MELRPYDDAQDRRAVRAWIDTPQTARWLTWRDENVSEEDLDAWCEVPGQSRWMFEHAGAPVGYGVIGADPQARTLELKHILVARDWRKQGIGREIAQALVCHAHARYPGWPIYARVMPDNIAALVAYPSWGFVPLDPLIPGFQEQYIWLIMPDQLPRDRGGSLNLH